MTGSRTLVAFHAHPDDEAISTGGTMAQAAAMGHRVVLVVATGGELGETPAGLLADGELLEDRRRVETQAAAEILGVSRVEFLGYRDSGMAGEATNDHPECFWTADVDEAGRRLADIIRSEGADVLTAYDQGGVYGHPDHVQVHRVGVRAAALAGLGEVFLATVDRDQFASVVRAAARAGVSMPGDVDESFLDTIGVPGAEITHRVDVRSRLAEKRAAMAAHASQIAESSFFLGLEPELFAEVFGREWFQRVELDGAKVDPAVAESIFGEPG